MENRENNSMKLSDGRILGYTEYGDPKGKPVFFFHGWPGTQWAKESIEIVVTK